MQVNSVNQNFSQKRKAKHDKAFTIATGIVGAGVGSRIASKTLSDAKKLTLKNNMETNSYLLGKLSNAFDININTRKISKEDKKAVAEFKSAISSFSDTIKIAGDALDSDLKTRANKAEMKKRSKTIYKNVSEASSKFNEAYKNLPIKKLIESGLVNSEKVDKTFKLLACVSQKTAMVVAKPLAIGAAVGALVGGFTGKGLAAFFDGGHKNVHHHKH